MATATNITAQPMYPEPLELPQPWGLGFLAPSETTTGGVKVGKPVLLAVAFVYPVLLVAGTGTVMRVEEAEDAAPPAVSISVTVWVTETVTIAGAAEVDAVLTAPSMEE